MSQPHSARFSTLLALAAWQLAAGSSLAQTVTEYPLPPPATSIEGIITGPDGNLWIGGRGQNKIYKLTPSGTVTAFDVPAPGGAPYMTVVGPDGNIWFAEESGGGRVGVITTAGVLTQYPTTTPSNTYSIVNGPDNNLWFTMYSANKIGKITPAGVVTEYNVPTPGATPYFITAGPDGNLYFTEFGVAGNRIAKITTAGVFTEFPPLPTANAQPAEIVTGVDGALWFTQSNGTKIGRITTAGVLTEYTIPTVGSNVFGITSGPDGALWFGEYGTNKVGRITTAGTITAEVIMPTASAGPNHLTTGPDKNIWVAEYNAGKVAKIDLPVPSANPLLASILPTSRSVQVGNYATVFATIANNSLTPQTQCRIATDTYVPGFFSYQTTNPATNALSGTPNTSASISANGLQTYVLAFRAGAPMPPTDVKLIYICDGVKGAAPITGVNTLQLVFDAGPVADMIAVGLTPSNDGFSRTGGNSGTGIFAIATTNIGPTTTLTAKPRLSSSMPVTATVCETNALAVCKAPPAASVTLSVANNATPTFAVFLAASGAIPPDPATKRVFLEFLDAGSVVRGSTSTAVTTQ